ncbi:MAG: Ig-like domain-containing protein [Lachnospiraceae bacterium]|nr:Ig-like domain-containing protein [Lachnospiraceae bacterium]
MYNNFSSKKTKKVISALLASALVVTSAPITADAATSKVLGVKKTFTVAGTKVTGLSKAEKKVVKVTIKNKKVTVKGLKAGKVTFKIGKKAYTVKVGATKVALTPAATSLKVNEKTKVAIVASNGKNDKLTVKTSNNSIVKISKSSVTANASGKASITLRGLAAGTSKITVTSKNTGKTASVKINVVADEVVTQAPVVSDSPVVSENPSESQAPVVSGDPSTSQAPATSNDPTVTTGAATAVPTAAPTTTSSAIIVAANAVVGNTSVALPATNVNAASKIYLTFDKDIDASSVISGNITVTKDGVKQLIAVTYNSAKKAAVIGMKTSVFDAGATYNVTVDGVKGTDGTAVKKYTTTFTVAQNAIVEAATYDKTGTDISLNGSVVDTATETISITFNRAMDITSAKNTANYRIYDVTDKKYIDKTGMLATTNATTGKTTATFTTSTLVAQHEYTLTVDGVVSLDGLAMLPTTCKFFFGVTPLSFVGGTTYTGEVACAANATAVTSVYGSLTAFKGHTPFTFKGQLTGDADVATVNADTVVLTDKATGNVVAANVTYENGSRYVILTPTADLKQDTTYVVTVDGVATDKGLSIAKSTFTFTVGDYQAPTIVSVTPENGEDKVAVNKNIVITFSEKMETLSSLIGKIELKDLTTNTVITPISNYYAASLSQDGKVLTLTNTKDLEVGTTYQVTVKGDGYTAASALDAAGNQLVSDYVTKFATVDATTTYVKAVTKNTTAYASTDSAIENGLTKVGTSDKFYFTFDKALLAVQPTTFRVALDVKAPNATVWTTGAATNVLTNSNKTIAVTPTLTPDKLYRITISGAKDINGNDIAEQVFTFTTGSAPSLVSTFPEQYAQNVILKNKYVFVTLNDADASDIDVSTLNAQTVKLIKSSDKSVAPYTLVSAQYKASETLDASVTTANATTTTFTATDGSKYAAGQLIKVGDKYAVVSSVEGNVVTLDRTITGGSPVAVNSVQGVVYKLNDDAQLEAKTQYEFSISGVKDVAGNEIDAATKKFTTAGAVQKLKFVSSSIEDGSVGVAVNSKLTLTFNEDVVNYGNGATIKVESEDTTVGDAGNITSLCDISQSNGVVTIAPKAILPAGKIYTVTVADTAASTEGTAIGSAKVIKFQTEANASVKPQVVSAKYVEGTSNSTIALNLNTPLTAAPSLTTAGNLKIDGTNIAVASAKLKNDGYTIVISITNSDLTAAGFVAGTSKVAITSAAKLTDQLGNAFSTDAVVIEK